MANTLNSPLNIPIRLDAMWSDGTTPVAPPLTDFSQLGGTALGAQSAPFKPWLGDTVRPPTLGGTPLAKGLHLHWTLPASLRRGKTVYVLDLGVFNELVQQGVPCSLVWALQQAAPAGSPELTLEALNALLSGMVKSPSPVASMPSGGNFPGLISESVVAVTNLPNVTWDPVYLEIYGPMIVRAAARTKLPPVPNRWLVIRTDASQNSTAWVVESDRLSDPVSMSPPMAPAGAGPTTVPAQFAGTTNASRIPVPQITGVPAFQYLGFTSPASTWSEPANSVPALTPFTAVGVGSADFAAFYPSCQGVFGFHDKDALNQANYTYTVIGWYSDPANDPVSSKYAVTPWSAVANAADRISKLSWTASVTPDWSKIDGSVYSAAISVTGDVCVVQSNQTALTGVQVSVGNTAGEALAAYLSKGITQTSALGLSTESVLNAAQAGVLRQAQEPDGGAVIENALHQQAFQSETHGSIWEVKPRAPAAGQAGLSPKLPAPPSPVSGAVAQALSVLNEAQLQFDRTQAYLASQRRLLFTDWCRVQHLTTDAEGPGNNMTIFPNGLTPNNFVTTTQIGLLAAQVLNQSAFSVDAAGMGDQDQSSMLAQLAAQALYSALSAMGQALAGSPGFELKRAPAPRFWRPNDPVVLMCDPDGNQLSPQSASQWPMTDSSQLKCAPVSPAANGIPGYLSSSWGQGPSGSCVAAIVSSPVVSNAVASWRPLLLQWETIYRPYPGAGGIPVEKTSQSVGSPQDYSKSFISSNFVPDPAGIELVASSSATAQQSQSNYSGRVVLSGHATATLRDQILRLAGLGTQDPPLQLDGTKLPGALGQGDAKSVLETAYENNPVSLSQTLDGFSDRLLMLRRIPQLSVFDPLFGTEKWFNTTSDGEWDSNGQTFYAEIGAQCAASPQQGDLYQPIRAGQCELSSLWLVDAFGQIRTWTMSGGNVTIASSFPKPTTTIQNAAPAFLLPPRFSQPSRLLFRWISADGSGDVESTRLPATSPICGWVALNRMDQSILVFEKDGTLLGWIPIAGGPMVAAPGAPSGPFADPFLNQVISQISSVAGQFYDDVSTALLTIEPRAHRQHTARSVLVSRPLALARASLRLELFGAPSPHQGYEWLASADLSTSPPYPTFGAFGAVTPWSVLPTALPAFDPYCPAPAVGGVQPGSPFFARESCGFTQVEFPVRLGDVSMDNDGLVAYWGLSANPSVGGWKISDSYNTVATSPSVQEGTEPTISLVCDPSVAATQVLMLLDPRAPVHVTSGILPTKAIDIPPGLYTHALRNMEYLMSVGPVLTPPDQILMPMPGELVGSWNWVTEDGGALNVISRSTKAKPTIFTGKIDDRAHFEDQPPVIREGWLQISKV